MFSAILTMVFVLSVSASAVHAAESDYEKVLKDVNRTNQEINEMVKRSITKVEQETQAYIKALQVIENGKEEQRDVQEKVLSELNRLKAEIESSDNKSSKEIKIKAVISELEAQADRTDKRIEDLTEKFNERVDAIIEQLVNQTDKKAAQTIRKGAQKGIIVICVKEEVQIGGHSVFIDPLIIAGF